MLLATQTNLGTMWKETTEGCEYQEMGTTGGLLEARDHKGYDKEFGFYSSFN